MSAAIVALVLPLTAHGHGGGLDSNGGHHNRKTGQYHYHRSPTPRPVVTLPAPVEDSSAARTDDEIKRVLINQSLGSYSGNCPCHYNTDRAGRSCGKRSAYSRPGGASPLCYSFDVSQTMVDDYRTKFGVDSRPTDEENVASEENLLLEELRALAISLAPATPA